MDTPKMEETLIDRSNREGGSYRHCASTVSALMDALARLERESPLLQIDPLAGREWYELLRQKLLPQLTDDAFLVVAVVGGTNIGKSVIFNHIANERASATSPRASGTKHPVCLVPPDFAQSHDLATIFHGFQLKPWSHSEAALDDRDEHLLYWKSSSRLPDNLIVFDTPDIDSDARVNWQRADHIRRCADVLIAVLTQQKYNDAAVKEFFRQAAREDKAVVVVFNQLQLDYDEEYWPAWLETFCAETGIEPELIYLAPVNRPAAEENRLSFFERNWPVESDDEDATTRTDRETEAAQESQRRNLTDDLSRLRFADIKLRTLRGSLRQLLTEDGVPSYLEEIRRRSEEFRAAAERLSSESVVKVRDWPTVPAKPIVMEIRRWWKQQHSGWAKTIHGVYDSVGQGVLWPFRFAKERISGKAVSPLEEYRALEWSAILKSIEDILEKLAWMSESGAELLKPSFERLLAGTSRQELLDRLRSEHEQVDLDQDLAESVKSEMQSFQTGSPELYRFYRNLNNVSAAVRPVTSVVLFSLGWGPAGHVVAPFIADAATQAIVPIVADFASGAAAAAMGESALSTTVGSSAGFLQAKFQRLQTAFTVRRVSWLVDLLGTHLLGDLPDELRTAAEIPRSEAFQNVQEILATLRSDLALSQGAD